MPLITRGHLFKSGTKNDSYLLWGLLNKRLCCQFIVITEPVPLFSDILNSSTKESCRFEYKRTLKEAFKDQKHI